MARGECLGGPGWALNVWSAVLAPSPVGRGGYLREMVNSKPAHDRRSIVTHYRRVARVLAAVAAFLVLIGTPSLPQGRSRTPDSKPWSIRWCSSFS